MEVLRSAKQGLKDRDVDRLTNFVFVARRQGYRASICAQA